jgi:hypothetical protein
MRVTVAARVNRDGSLHQAWLDKDADIDLASEGGHIRSDFEFATSQIEGGLSSSISSLSPSRYAHAQRFSSEAWRHSRLSVRLPELDGPILLRFDLTGMISTPVQHMIERCLPQGESLAE